MIKYVLFFISSLRIFCGDIHMKAKIVLKTGSLIEKSFDSKKDEFVGYNYFFDKAGFKDNERAEYVLFVNSELFNEKDTVKIDNKTTIEFRQKRGYIRHGYPPYLKKEPEEQFINLCIKLENIYVMTGDEIKKYINTIEGIDDTKSRIKYDLDKNGYCREVKIEWLDEDFGNYEISFCIKDTNKTKNFENFYDDCKKFGDFNMCGKEPKINDDCFACYSYLTPFHLRFIGAKIYKTYYKGDEEVSREEIEIQSDEGYKKFLELKPESNYERDGKHCEYIIEIDEITKVFNCYFHKEGFESNKCFAVYLPGKFTESDCERFLLDFFKLTRDDVIITKNNKGEITINLKKNSKKDFNYDNFPKKIKIDNNFGNTIPEDIELEIKDKNKDNKKNCCCCF